jgi:glycosyltransferase involved in cell wall biosynthesis
MIARLEREILANARHRTTTSRAMAKALADAYGVVQPLVVYNSIPVGGEVGPTPDGDLRLFWFSQTVGQGRGLELLFDALASLEAGWKLTILGRCATQIRESFLGRLPSSAQRRVSFLDYIPPGDLQQETTRHDVGLALETASCLNHQYTTSNKIFQYLQAGLFVVATATAGHVEVVRELPEHGRTFPVGDKSALSSLLSEMIGHKEDVRRKRRQCAAAADQRFGYEHSARALVESVKAAVA